MKRLSLPLRCSGVVITAAQLHSTKPELRFCTGSNPACGVSEIRDREDLWQWSQLEIRLTPFIGQQYHKNNSSPSSSTSSSLPLLNILFITTFFFNPFAICVKFDVHFFNNLFCKLIGYFLKYFQTNLQMLRSKTLKI